MISRTRKTERDDRGGLPEPPILAARIARSRLSVLAPLRDHPDLRVALNQSDGTAWLRWTKPDPEILRLLRPIPGIELYSHESGHWRPFGSLLPAESAPPALGDMASLCAVLQPRPVAPEPPRESWKVDALRLVPAERPRPSSALLAAGRELIAWADVALTSELDPLQAAWSGDRILLVGHRLPWVVGTRFWGSRILTPLGLEPDPLLPEPMLAEAVGLESEELALLFPDGSGPRFQLLAEVVPREALRPLTRAGLRLAALNQGESPP